MALHRNAYGPAGRLAKPPVDLLLCFAVPEEMKFFRAESWKLGTVQVWSTGIGPRNAAESIRDAIAKVRPARVISAGFAGGLNPALNFGAVLYEQDSDAGFARELEQLGVLSAKFHCHRRIAATVAEKRSLRLETGADAVEMESSVIRAVCHEFKIPAATVRVISDDATQDLPLDFNALMTSEDRINYLKLVRAILFRPGRIPKLIQFRRQTMIAARKLGAVLEDLLRAQRC